MLDVTRGERRKFYISSAPGEKGEGGGVGRAISLRLNTKYPPSPGNTYLLRPFPSVDLEK